MENTAFPKECRTRITAPTARLTTECKGSWRLGIGSTDNESVAVGSSRRGGGGSRVSDAARTPVDGTNRAAHTPYHLLVRNLLSYEIIIASTLLSSYWPCRLDRNVNAAPLDQRWSGRWRPTGRIQVGTQPLLLGRPPKACGSGSSPHRRRTARKRPGAIPSFFQRRLNVDIVSRFPNDAIGGSIIWGEESPDNSAVSCGQEPAAPGRPRSAHRSLSKEVAPRALQPIPHEMPEPRPLQLANTWPRCLLSPERV